MSELKITTIISIGDHQASVEARIGDQKLELTCSDVERAELRAFGLRVVLRQQQELAKAIAEAVPLALPAPEVIAEAQWDDVPF